MSPALFLSGSCTVAVSALHRTAAMNLCMQMGLQYRNFIWCSDGSVRFCCTIPAARRFLAACRKRDIEAEVIARRGLPRLLGRIAERTGLVTGAVLALGLILLSGLFLWDVQVSGNEHLTEEEVKKELRESGFGVGSYLPGLRTREVENRVLMHSKSIGWLSINRRGTVAHVQIIERVCGNPGEGEGKDPQKPANLVAARDGQIEYLELYRGNAVVTVGQAVKAGELLVSGLYDSQTGSIRVTHAAGRVMARTEHTLEVEIPLLYEKKVYEDPYLCGIELHFFDFSKKISKNCGNQDILCDIIEYKYTLGKVGNNRLPVALVRSEAHPYHFEWQQRSTEEALALAYVELSRRLAELAGEAELLKKQITTQIGENSILLICQLTCIQDIAAEQEFEITE